MAVIEIFDMDDEQAATEINPAPIIRAKRSPRKKADDSATTPQGAQNDDDAAQPKKRGRPRKDASAPNETPQAQNAKSADKSDSTGKFSEKSPEKSPEKSRRGRPKKAAVLADTSSSVEISSDTSADTTSAASSAVSAANEGENMLSPRGRGRGRKPATPENDNPQTANTRAEKSRAEKSQDGREQSTARNSSRRKSATEKSATDKSATDKSTKNKSAGDQSSNPRSSESSRRTGESNRHTGESNRGRKSTPRIIHDEQHILEDSTSTFFAQDAADENNSALVHNISPNLTQLAITGIPPRIQLPFAEFSPTENALAMSMSILPAVESPLGLYNAERQQEDSNADADRPSKSRSRSARRRRAAAKRKAEAASDQTSTSSAWDEDNEIDDSNGTNNSYGAHNTGNDLEATHLLLDDASRFGNRHDDMPDAVPDGVRDGVEIVSRESMFRETDMFESGTPSFAPERPVSPERESESDVDSERTSAQGPDLAPDRAPDREGADEGETTSEPARTGRSRSRGQSRRKRGREVKPVEKPESRFDEDLDDFIDEDEAPIISRSTDRKMLVSVLPGELVEVVVLETGKVQEYYVEMEHQAKIRGSIYKGIVSNIDVNLQAAFINFGGVKNGFLQIDEVHPEYWLTHHEPTKGHKHPPIQKVMKPGQEVLVQVVKEPSGSKGAFLTTWVSLAGRFLVLTPGQEQIGISRKVEDGEERNRLRELIKGLSPGEGLGAIVRTVSAGTSKTTLQKDLSFLKRVWKDIRKRAGTEKAPALIYKEPSLATRAVRDYLSDDVSEVWVDDTETAEAIRDMTGLLFPRKADLLHVHQDTSRTLWERFKVKKSLDQIHAREVILPSGGRLVFDQTEALMAIDINSGKSGGKTNFESMAQRTNVEAAEMIAHQLRLRDVGGQVVIDFIEMRDQSHVREVEKTMRNAMKLDRARYDIGKMSTFGLMQIVRQRIGSSAISISQEACPHCMGTGLRRNLEWQSLQQLRDLKVQMRNAAQTAQTEFTLPLEAELALYMLNHKRDRLTSYEKEYGIQLVIKTLLG